MAWHVVNVASSGAMSPNYVECIIDSENDINTEPDWKSLIGYKPAIGSVAYTCAPGGSALDKLWMRASDGTWSSL